MTVTATALPAASDLRRAREMANAIRALAMDAVEAAQSGHPGMPMGLADAATVLCSRFLRVDPSRPDWPDRDRFVLSNGHGSMLLYAIHHLLGYTDMGIEELRRFRQLGARTPGHPEYRHTLGVETTTGPLGQGLANAVGMALAERLDLARFGEDLVDHWTYVFAGDGCLMEGVSQEAIDLAGHLGLGRLIVLWDDNAISIDGATDLATTTDQAARFEASGWHVVRDVDGHDPEAVAAAIEAARADPQPSMIACRTVIGFGAPKKAGTAAAHGAPLGAEEVAGAKAAIGWTHPPFEVPADIRAAWAEVAARGAAARAAWEGRLAHHPESARFLASRDGGVDPAALDAALAPVTAKLAAERPSIATRRASQLALEAINPVLPTTIAGSADLTGSNNTKTAGLGVITAADFAGRYIHYGVREHAMGAVMNGLALHGGLIPYAGTFLVFADYMRPAIRLSALMGLRVVYVMTHDSIGLGEDGPTHQPVEHLASLRAIPNLLVMRPADGVETAECWKIALTESRRPSILALTRQNVPSVRAEAGGENRCAAGAYVLREASGPRAVTLIGTGSEVAIALAAAGQLASEGIAAAVVSAPCLELFAEQPAEIRAAVLGDAPRVVVEAGVEQGWGRILGERGGFVGMASFGASAPYEQLYAHFEITPDRVAEVARGLVRG